MNMLYLSLVLAIFAFQDRAYAQAPAPPISTEHTQQTANAENDNTRSPRVASSPESLNKDRAALLSDRRSLLDKQRRLDALFSETAGQYIKSPSEKTLAELRIMNTHRSDIIDQINAIDQILSYDDQNNTMKMYLVIVVVLFLSTMIIGLLFIAFRDADVRASFSMAGILQFSALFSIIIAIIVFGMAKILEAKELAALLGGLAGYILGRGALSPERPASNQPAPPSSK